MSKKRAYYIDSGRICYKVVDFAHSTKGNIDKKKAISAMHRKLEKIDGKRVTHLDINIRNPNALAKKLAPYQISLRDYKVESIYQASKIFDHGGPYNDLEKVSVADALNDPRIKDSGNVVDFFYNGEYWERNSEYFYDFLYVSAVRESISNEELKELLKYDYFTDLETKYSAERNPARAVAIIKLMLMQFGEIPPITKKDFVTYCRLNVAA